MFHDILILGGGASGIMSAIISKDMGKDVAIIEGSQRIGNKILMTGNGRCNITNSDISLDRYHCENKNFPKYSLENFSLSDTEDFFMNLGLPISLADNKKMYPLSLQASSVLDILRMALEDRSIPVYLNNKVKNIATTLNGFKIETNSNKLFSCNKIILCCGGKSASNTGSDGSGFTLAQKLGHSIIHPLPALVQLKLAYKNLKALSGVKFNGNAQIFVNGEPLKKDFGEILFTDYGISGPPILQLSRTASCALYKNKSVKLCIDMMPNTHSSVLKESLENHWGIFSYRSVFDSFIGIINKKIIPILLKEASIKDIHKPCFELGWMEKQKIIELLKNWQFTVSGTNAFKNSQVTAGGVNTSEINPVTLESKIIKNLFFAGEVMDVDGDCGGFNLQWAWSSGFTAGKSAAK